jgi:hypothetical protein
MVIKLVKLLEHIKPQNIKVCAHSHPEQQVHKMHLQVGIL